MKSEQRGRKAATTAMGGRGGGESLRENQKERDVRHANIVAARGALVFADDVLEPVSHFSFRASMLVQPSRTPCGRRSDRGAWTR
eukprot:scaffold495_cov243-Pinguiococcus_pyrenoidosus.AAC.6